MVNNMNVLADEAGKVDIWVAIVFPIVGLLVGIIVGCLIYILVTRIKDRNAGKKAIKIVEEAEIKAEHIKKNAQLDAKQATLEMKQEAERDIKERKEEVVALESKMLQREEDNYPLEEMTDTGMTELLMPLENISLEDQLANIGVSFHDKLFELIDEAHLDNKDVWKRANLDRKHFSKIQCDQNYHPKKKTVMALCIALQLDLEQSRDLLARADWAFSPSSKVDLIVQKAIIDKQYDIMQLNVTLFKYTNEILGV